MPTVDVIVPVRNEEEAIRPFLDRVAALKLPRSIALRLIFVEDSSTDGTRPLLRRLAGENPHVGYYTVAPGLGQGAAVTFGLSRSAADAMIMMDGDGSHPVEVIPEMVQQFLSGAEVVQCVRKSAANRRRYRDWASALFFGGAYALTGVNLRRQNVFYRLISKTVARQILAQPRYWNYLRFPLPRRPEGAVRLIEVDMEERQMGESKYGFWRLVRLAIDGVLSLMPAPRFAALLGAAGLLAVILLRLRRWPLALAVAVAMLWLIREHRLLRRHDLLDRMQVVECGGVAATPTT